MPQRANRRDSKDEEKGGAGRAAASRPPRRFATTRWSVVVAAGRTPSPDTRQALAALCEAYWYPLYAFVRRKGHSVDDAQDLTQAFFAELLEKDRLRAADRERGRFRTFLLASLEHFLANQWRRAGAAKRGRGRPTISLDLERGESQYRLEPAHELTPEKLYERRWALTMLDNALSKLREEYAQREKLDLFDRLRGCLGGDKQRVPYAQLAADLDMTEAAIKVAVHRLRKRYRDILRAEIAETVDSPEEIDDELRDLFRAVM
jgi:RNA polymerase sigma factor (sigma-70 family)